MGALKNTKHELFAQKVAHGDNPSTAYEAVYGKDKKRGATRGQASALRSKLIVAARIRELQDAAAEQAIITKAEVLKGLKNIAALDLGRCYDEKGVMKHVQDMPKSIRTSLAGVEVLEEFEGTGRDRFQIGETRKVKTHDRVKAYELLGKHLGLFPSNVKHSGEVKIGLEELVAGSGEDEEEKDE